MVGVRVTPSVPAHKVQHSEKESLWEELSGFSSGYFWSVTAVEQLSAAKRDVVAMARRMRRRHRFILCIEYHRNVWMPG